MLELGLASSEIATLVHGNPHSEETVNLSTDYNLAKKLCNAIIRKAGPELLAKRLVAIDWRGHGDSPEGAGSTAMVACSRPKKRDG